MLSAYIFIPIYTAQNIIIPYAVHPFNICVEYPILWKNLKIAYILANILSNTIIANTIYNLIKHKKVKKQKSIEQITQLSKLNIYVGKNEQNQLIYIPESGLYQNILVTRNYR